MKLSDYIVLIHKQLRGEIDPNEANKLDQWMDRQPDASLREDMGKIWQLSTRYKDGYEPEVQQGLTRFKARLKEEQAALAVKPQLRARRSWLAAAAALALLVTAGLWWVMQGSSDAYAYSTAAGETQELTLPDGSRVLLNESSVLTYLSGDNATGDRAVRLSGEAFFSVKKDASRPFVIETQATRTTVLGTAFNVRAYPQEPTEEVEVVEGRVRLEQKQGEESVELQPLERGVCQTKAGELYKLEVSHANAPSWYTHELEFKKERLAPALLEIERYYNVKLRLSNPDLKDCLYNAKLKGVTLDDFIRSLEAVFGLEVRQPQPGVFVLEGGRCR